MFNVSGGEVIIILVLALVVLGPEKLPEVLRKAGKLYGDVRRMTNGFQAEFEETFAEPLREFRETATQAREMVNNPLAGFSDDSPAPDDSSAPSVDAPDLQVATGSEPPYAPIAQPHAPLADFAPPAPASLLPPPAPAVPLPPPTPSLWNAPPVDKRLDPWASDGAAP